MLDARRDVSKLTRRRFLHTIFVSARLTTMKLLRFGPAGDERPGLLDADGQIRSLEGVVDDIAGETLSEASLDRLRKLDPKQLEAMTTPVRIGPCVGKVGKIMCIGLNYAEHA